MGCDLLEVRASCKRSISACAGVVKVPNVRLKLLVISNQIRGGRRLAIHLCQLGCGGEQPRYRIAADWQSFQKRRPGIRQERLHVLSVEVSPNSRQEGLVVHLLPRHAVTRGFPAVLEKTFTIPT